MGGFSTLNTAISGLTAAQRGLDVTGQNIVNANTPGYSRQQVRLASVNAPIAADYHTRNYGAMIGGVTVEDVTRIRDSFLEGARAAAGSAMEALTAQTAALTGVETLLAEPGDGGLQTVMDTFYNSWHELATADEKDSAGAGAVVIANGRQVADRLSFISQGLQERWTTAHEELDSTVSQLNRAAADLAKVNDKIRESSIIGRVSNELLDQRDVLVRTLADLAGATAKPADNGMVNVSVNGISLVAGAHAEKFTIGGAVDLASATSDPPSVTFGPNNVPVQGGRAAGLLAALRSDLPGVSARLDDIAIAFRDVVNTIHSEGYTLAGAPAGDFFAGGGASNLTVLITRTADLGISGEAGAIDGSNARRLGDLTQDVHAEDALGGATSPSQRWRTLTADIGTQVQGLGRALESQGTVLNAAEAAVEADAGVNLDEEMSSMLMFQRSYQAAARVITTVDEMLDTLINRTGTVGR